jgi:hypothetical protein
MPTDNERSTRLRLGPIEYALLLVPWGWVLVWTRLWNQYHDLAADDARGDADDEEPRAAYGPAPVDWIDHALLFVPYGWPLVALRHSEALLGDALGVRSATIGAARGPLLPGWAESSLALGRSVLSMLGLMPDEEPPKPRRRRAAPRAGRATGRGPRGRVEPANADAKPSAAPER